jgi:hypothetical protein
MNMAKGLQLDLSKYPNIKSWLSEMGSRPAWKKLADLRETK